MIYDKEDVMALSLDHIRVEVSVWMRYLGLRFIRNGHLWLLLNDGARIAILVKFVKEGLHVPCVEPSVEGSSELRFGRMSYEMCAVVHVIQGSRSHIVWDNYLLSGFSGNKDCRVPFRHQQTVRSDGRVFYQEPDLIVHISRF